MSTARIRVGIIFGGRSAEHEVSLQSARNIIDALDKSKYDPVLIGIDKQGCWHSADARAMLEHAEDPRLIRLKTSGESVALVPGGNRELVALDNGLPAQPVDVVFPVLHGTYGEDGTVQGLLKLADVPFVGAGVLGSAVGMDKDVMKRLLRDAGIPIADFLVFRASDDNRFDAVTARLGTPVFVKPANLGSSVGIGKAATESEFQEAVREAFQFDRKIVVEECIRGRELECSVLGNDDPIASVPGEVIPHRDFYSYEAKYIDEHGAALVIPADVDAETVARVQRMAVEAFKVLCCEGMARADFFLREDGQLLLNEINTIPGFTRISMYPKLWEASGLPYGQLLDRLIALAMERHAQEKRLKTSHEA